MECVAYMRVSTEKQAEEGNGLDSQKRDIELFCRKNELVVSDWYVDDGYTGANMDRPELQRLINDCIKKLADVWAHIDKKEKNNILKSIISRIVIVNGDVEIQLKNF